MIRGNFAPWEPCGYTGPFADTGSIDPATRGRRWSTIGHHLTPPFWSKPHALRPPAKCPSHHGSAGSRAEDLAVARSIVFSYRSPASMTRLRGLPRELLSPGRTRELTSPCWKRRSVLAAGAQRGMRSSLCPRFCHIVGHILTQWVSATRHFGTSAPNHFGLSFACTIPRSPRGA